MQSVISTPHGDTPADSPMVLAAIAAAGCVGEVMPMVFPLILGGVMVEFGVSEGTAGFAPALEVAAIAAAAVLFSVLGHRLSPRLAVWSALVLAILGHALSSASPTWSIFMFSRVLAGIGEGVLLASANVQASLTRRPHRSFSILLAVIITCFLIMAAVIPAAVMVLGPRGPFVAMLGLAVVAAGFTLRFPGRRMRSERHDGDGGTRAHKTRLMVAAILVYLAFSSVWVYSGRIGASVGLSLDEVGKVVMACGVVGALGPVLAGLVGLRWGRTAPLLVSLATIAATALMLVTASSQIIFVVALVVIMWAFMFFVTYLRGLMAAMDPTGGLVGVGVGVLLFGGAVGPLFAGLMLNAGGGYLSLGVLALLCCCCSMVLSWQVVRHVDRWCEA